MAARAAEEAKQAEEKPNVIEPKKVAPKKEVPKKVAPTPAKQPVPSAAKPQVNTEKDISKIVKKEKTDAVEETKKPVKKVSVPKKKISFERATAEAELESEIIKVSHMSLTIISYVIYECVHACVCKRKYA